MCSNRTLFYNLECSIIYTLCVLHFVCVLSNALIHLSFNKKFEFTFRYHFYGQQLLDNIFFSLENSTSILLQILI